jgi:hypothetical protein
MNKLFASVEEHKLYEQAEEACEGSIVSLVMLGLFYCVCLLV